MESPGHQRQREYARRCRRGTPRRASDQPSFNRTSNNPIKGKVNNTANNAQSSALGPRRGTGRRVMNRGVKPK